MWNILAVIIILGESGGPTVNVRTLGDLFLADTIILSETFQQFYLERLVDQLLI